MCRAGRPQFDTEGVAVIMTDRQVSNFCRNHMLTFTQGATVPPCTSLHLYVMSCVVTTECARRRVCPQVALGTYAHVVLV